MKKIYDWKVADLSRLDPSRSWLFRLMALTVSTFQNQLMSALFLDCFDCEPSNILGWARSSTRCANRPGVTAGHTKLSPQQAACHELYNSVDCPECTAVLRSQIIIQYYFLDEDCQLGPENCSRNIYILLWPNSDPTNELVKHFRELILVALWNVRVLFYCLIL